MPSSEEWRGPVGAEWAAQADVQDRFLAPFGELGLRKLAEMAGPDGPGHVLDLGCGAGASTFQLARDVKAASATGLELSPDLVHVANARRASEPSLPVSFIEANAETHDFGASRYDALFSRFGSMFFDNPVAAFSNLHGALRPGGLLCLVAWRPAADNDWATGPLAAAHEATGNPLFGPPEDGSGPFGWADTQTFAPVLAEAGFRDVTWADLTAEAPLSDPDAEDPAADATALSLRIGPLTRRLKGQPPELRDTVIEATRRFYASRIKDGVVKVKGAVRVITGTA